MKIYALISVCLYLSCTISLWLQLRGHPWLQHHSKSLLLSPGIAAILIHAFILYSDMATAEGINLGFYNAASMVAWCITTFTLIAAMRYPVEMLGIIVLPVSAIALALEVTNTSVHMLPPDSPLGLNLHVLISIIAYSVLGLATVHAILFAMQNHYLHTHQPGGMVRLLPPLQVMESLLFESIALGFILLSLSLLSGFMFLENMFAQHLAHKTVLSIVAWSVFAVLLAGHRFIGWRGRKAVNWTIGGFISLMLAYFGSKFVLEIVLVNT